LGDWSRRGTESSILLEIWPKAFGYGDAAYNRFLDNVDAYIERTKMKVPEDPQARATFPDSPCVAEPLRQLDKRDLSSVIWATGYTFDFSWIDLPIFNARGEPRHNRGVSSVPGIYFLGLPWLSKMNSLFLSGVGEDAARLADRIEATRSLNFDHATKSRCWAGRQSGRELGGQSA
jgi:putative flavoprotein involved in K+ transport